MRYAANLLIIAAAALCKSALAFSTGAGACPEGGAAVGGLHLNNPTTGTLATGGFTVSLGGTALIADGTSTFSTNTDVTLTISGGTFRGFLMRLGENGGVSTDNAFLDSGSDIQGAPVCTDVGGVTHTSSTDKSTVSATLNMAASAVDMPLDVTVVVKNSGGVSEFYYSQFLLTAASSPVIVVDTLGPTSGPTLGPTLGPTPPPTAAVTPAPTDAPFVETPAPVPVTPAPVTAAPVPVTAAPVPVTAVPETSTPGVVPRTLPPTSAPLSPSSDPLTATVTPAPVVLVTAAPVVTVIAAPVPSPIVAPVTSAPVPAPVPAPVAPTPTISASPSIDSTCEDLPGSFLVDINGTTGMKDCIWLSGRKQVDLNAVCVASHPAYYICEESCGTCDDGCDDSVFPVMFEVEYDNGNVFNRTCSWLSDRPRWQSRLCVVGHPAMILCPETCESCAQPSAAPSSKLSGTSAPIIPLTPPALIAPSVAPETGNPAAIDLGPDLMPISKDVSPGPTPTIASLMPSVQETTPSTGTLLITTCEDASVSYRFFFHNGLYRSCAYLATKPELIALYCKPGELAYTKCPETCGLCDDGCEDNAEATFNVANIVLSCQSLSLRPKFQTALCIPGHPAMTLCPETCESCGQSSSPSVVSTIPSLATSLPATLAPVAPVPAPVAPETPAPVASVPDNVVPETPAPVVPVPAPVIDLAPPAPIAPVASPGPSLVTAANDCQDDPTFTFYVDKKKTQNCAWLSDRRPEQTLHCGARDVKTACQKTCGYCKSGSTCKDNGSARVSIVTNKTKGSKSKVETCKWLKANPDLWFMNCGVGSEAHQMCQDTCNSCAR